MTTHPMCLTTLDRLALLLQGLLLAALGAGCSLVQPTRVGSGVVASETRPLAPFHGVSIAGQAEVLVRAGPEYQVQVSYDDNLLIWVETEVQGEDLEIRLAGPARYETKAPLRVEIVTPRLDRLAVAGSARVEATQIDTPSLGVSLAGSSHMRLAGRVEDLEVSIAGSGELDLRELAATRAEVSIAGSGDVQLQASESLDVSIAGSGKVAYLGDPQITRSVLGSGSLVPLAP